ncbi:helix-turn-helix domain-containing protein [Chitinophaga tropicalis]|uniref:Helix-turn-helix domain-containing protein n=1 Tax=Chitinophaga tropicalis TaxID=2683588 RepID=A0A7K1U0S9_9BACT|nr:AraC family transcriptional regulator [Chitinophaga tropicalis]MVT07900.1 helix-turn-helix domain-containing protein [Chitinophaga tropicalis]
MKKIPVRHISEPALSGSFSIRDIQALLAGEDMIQPLHRHDFFYVLVIEKGSGKHEIDFTPYTISDNTIFFMRPGQVHQLTLNAGCTGYMMLYNTNFFTGKAVNINLYQPGAERFRKLSSVLTYIFRECAEKQEGYEEVIKANLSIFLIELGRQHSEIQPKHVTPYIQEQLDKFLALLDTHIAGYKQVSDYAGMLNLSLYQLNSITRTALGKTSSELLNERIILEAKRYLLATSEQVKEIAYHLGYEDVSYFTRFFKKHTGYTPVAFRDDFR